MPCYKPIDAYQPVGGLSDRRLRFRLSPKDEGNYRPTQISCGQCIGCRLERSRQWAVRCVHEAQMHQDNCFITLTYNDENLPPLASLQLDDYQRFMKRLRKKYGSKIRFFHCGEYGEKYGRPHYHAILFNHDFDDKYHWRTTDQGHRCYRSPSLEKLWPYGNCEIGDVTFESAAYVARYIMKKVTGSAAEHHYCVGHTEYGELLYKKPEYVTMSRRPGIGSSWFQKYHTDVYPDDFVVIRNDLKTRPPKYYDKLLSVLDGHLHDDIKYSRELSSEKFLDNNTPERLHVREQCQQARLKLLVRNLE
ncbi:MAG: replication initiator protein [Arizlama microvirus]|nr:MAG: replication initiator protein [Arizlama microvirus]